MEGLISQNLNAESQMSVSSVCDAKHVLSGSVTLHINGMCSSQVKSNLKQRNKTTETTGMKLPKQSKQPRQPKQNKIAKTCKTQRIALW